MSDAERQQQVAQALEAITAELHADVLVVGGGLRGDRGRDRRLPAGRQVVLTEQTDWVGGQLTAQAPPSSGGRVTARDGSLQARC
jgi:heterodisulfide reductase subunit A-like polyferredoxin